MTITQSLFYFLSFAAIVTALLVVFAKNPMHSVIYLILTFFILTGHYILLNAHFIAVVNMIVYAGAIMVLFLFVVMLLNLSKEQSYKNSFIMRLGGVILAGLILLLVTGAVKALDNQVSLVVGNINIGTVESLGKVLFNEFMLPFEVVSLLLLTSMVGSVLLAKKESN